MRVIVLDCPRCNPRKTLKKLEQIPGSGIAYISEHTPNMPREVLSDDWREIVSPNNDEKYYCKGLYAQYNSEKEMMEDLAKGGWDIFYKTASLGGAHRVYVRPHKEESK